MAQNYKNQGSGATQTPAKSAQTQTQSAAPRGGGAGAAEGYSAQQLMLSPDGQPNYEDQLRTLRPELREQLDGLDTDDRGVVGAIMEESQARPAELDEHEQADIGGQVDQEQTRTRTQTHAPEPLDQVEVSSDTPVRASTGRDQQSGKLADRNLQVKAGETKDPSYSYKAENYKSDSPTMTAVGEFKTKAQAGEHDDAFKVLKDNPQDVAGVGWPGITASQRAAMAAALTRNADVTSDAGKARLKVMAFSTPSSETAVIIDLFEVRFNLDVGQTLSTTKTGIDWSSAGILRSWTILDTLPAGHVENSGSLDHWTRFVGGHAFYSGSRQEAGFGYNGVEGTTGTDPEGNPLDGVKWFNSSVRHEVGHAVDDQLGSQTDDVTDARGPRWETHSDQMALTAMLGAANSCISTWSDAAQKTEIEAALLDCMQNKTPDELRTKYEAMSFWSRLTSGQQNDIWNDVISITVRDCGSEDKAPWNNLSGMGYAIGGRHYQVRYDDWSRAWVSYDPTALSQKASRYQFRAPGEWFAEAYACYYQPDTEGNTGTLLNEVDPSTKRWFDTHVNT